MLFFLKKNKHKRTLHCSFWFTFLFSKVTNSGHLQGRGTKAMDSFETPHLAQLIQFSSLTLRVRGRPISPRTLPVLMNGTPHQDNKRPILQPALQVSQQNKMASIAALLHYSLFCHIRTPTPGSGSSTQALHQLYTVASADAISLTMDDWGISRVRGKIFPYSSGCQTLWENLARCKCLQRRRKGSNTFPGSHDCLE